jgi:hypothetical protein
MLTPTYHPLDGQELLDWILHELEQNLRAHIVFARNIVYHNPKFCVNIHLETWAAEGKYKTGEADATVDAQKSTPSAPDGARSVTENLAVDYSVPLLEPDKARDAAKLGRYATEKVGDVMVDVKKERSAIKSYVSQQVGDAPGKETGAESGNASPKDRGAADHAPTRRQS